MSSFENGKKSSSLGPPWPVVIVEAVLVLAILQVARWLIPLSGQLSIVIWVGVGLPLAAAAHRFNKVRYGAATRPPLWGSKSR